EDDGRRADAGRLLSGLPELHGDHPGAGPPRRHAELGVPARAVTRAHANAGVPGPGGRTGRDPGGGRRVARHVARTGGRAPEVTRAAREERRRVRSVLRPRWSHARRYAAGAEAQVRGTRARDLSESPDGALVVQLPSGSLRQDLRHQDSRGRNRRDRVPGLRSRAVRDGALQDARDGPFGVAGRRAQQAVAVSTVSVCAFAHLDPRTYVPHELHGSVRAWTESNCY